MYKSHLLATASIVVGALALIAQPAVAQVTTGAQLSEEQAAKAAAGNVAGVNADSPTGNGDDAIVVTGTRIVAPNLQSTVPITTLSGEQFFKTGNVSVIDTLNQLPQLRSTFSSQNSTRFLGTAGLGLLDLRGLGTQRTLVLINGRRQVGADILVNGVSVDTNTIPTDLVESVDTVTGGNSSIYGSDAIAGVINFKLKQDFDGFQVRGQAGISKYSDAGSQYISVLAGKNFAEGRGNVALNLEYAHQDIFYATDRPTTRNQNGFVIVDQDLASDPNVVNNSDGNPDRVFFRDIRSATYADGGLVAFASPSGACGRDPILATTATAGAGVGQGRPFSCNYLFTPQGTLVPQAGQRVGLGTLTTAGAASATPTGSFIGGNGSNFRNADQLGLIPRQQRFSANMLAHFDVSDALTPFIEAKYVRVNTFGSSSGPAFTNGGTFGVGSAEQFRLDNPYLSDQARTLITQQLIAGGASPDSITDQTRFALRRNLLDLGSRAERSIRETFRVVGGLRGTFNDDWHYEISGEYSQLKEATTVLGNLNVQRYLLATDTVRNAAGQIVCRAQTDGGATAIDYGNTPDDARLAADIAACQPLNPFGSGNISPAARNYVIQDTVSHGKITQAVANAFVSGDSSQLFELPGGPVYFSLGGEYRRETLRFKADPLVENGYTFYNALPTFSAPSFEVKEAFGELHASLIKDTFLLQDLQLSGSGRVADYKGATGTVYAYGGGVTWVPVHGLLLRANYSRSVRAPNLSELYTAQGQNFATGFVDPCAARNISTGTANRVANCRAAGIPASFDYFYTQSLQYLSGGNENLRAEKSDSWTFGGVLTPSMLRGLAITVDYYKITVKDVITSPTAQQIANACYDLPDLNNPFCGLFQRNSATDATDPYRIVEGSLQATLLNYAKLRTRGIDVSVAYSHRFGDVQVGTKLDYNHQLQNSEYLDPTRPNYENRLLSELAYPKNSFVWNVDFQLSKIALSYRMRYLSPMYLNTFEDYNSLQGRAPENPDYADRETYPSVLYHNVRAGFDATDKMQLYIGVDNIGNRLPPLGLTGTGDGSGVYDIRGRYMYAGVNAKF